MKKFISFFLALFMAFSLFANITFAVDYAIFNSMDDGPYIEFYLSINGNSVAYAQQEDSLFQANIEVTYLIEKGEEVISFQKFQVNSPKYTLEDMKLDLLDLKRMPLKEGDFTYTLIAKDLINQTKAEVTEELRSINFAKDNIHFSEIELANDLEKSTENTVFTKGGYDLTPNVSHAYGKNKNKLVAYFEVYHADKTLGNEEGYLIDVRIEDKATAVVTSNLRAIKRMKASVISPIIQSFDLEELPSGEYELIVEARNRNNEVIAATKNSFVRSNPSLKNLEVVGVKGTFVDSIDNKELLAEYIKSLFPISSAEERLWSANQLRYADMEYMQRFFLNFWKERNKLDPETAWLKYRKEVEIAHKEFGYGNVPGYSTERGRVYLQYGKPNTVQNVPYDRDTYPYAIWQYYRLNGQTDRKFIFYSPSMEMLGYDVLHSNVPGERNNPNWEIELVSKTAGGIRNTQEIPTGTTIQREARDLFDNPR